MDDEEIKRVLTEISEVLGQIEETSIFQAVDLIAGSDRIFVTGAGRSGLCMRAFSQRLMHLGKQVHVLGETTTPSAQPGDLLIIGSGSGKTKGLMAIAEKAIGIGVNILLITTSLNSPMAAMTANKIIIPASSLNPESEHISIQPMGALFEQSLFVLCDCMILGLMELLDVDEDDMRRRHGNLE